MSETSKIRNKIQKYLNGKILDIGCGNDKVCPEAIGIDGRSVFEGGFIQEGLTDFPEHMNNTVDVVYSSHTLEHMQDDYATLISWGNLLKKGGLIILYLPDGRYYNNYENLEHMRDYQYEQFMMFFKRAFCGEGKNYKGEFLPKIFEIIEEGPDVGTNRYSFYLVAKKI
jgi:predicted SAM-dependent methyltransferase